MVWLRDVCCAGIVRVQCMVWLRDVCCAGLVRVYAYNAVEDIHVKNSGIHNWNERVRNKKEVIHN